MGRDFIYNNNLLNGLKRDIIPMSNFLTLIFTLIFRGLKELKWVIWPKSCDVGYTMMNEFIE